MAVWHSLVSARPRLDASASDAGNGGLDASELLAVRESYTGFLVPTVGYGTVRDFSDSLGRLTRLATAQGDLKDAQRPWMVKALWSLLPMGGRVLEIGAGQPYVADVLQRSGFEVTIVDPYDGSANGPVDYVHYLEHYPALQFVRTRFDTQIARQLPARSYDAVFSISVLEHLPPDELADVTIGMRSLLRDSGWSIHNLDHTLHGSGQAVSLERLTALAQQHGVTRDHVLSTLREAERDPETYFLSAESHERWRAYLGLGYDNYPMQRVVSISVAGKRGELKA